jgi:heme exporter protein CcmD
MSEFLWWDDWASFLRMGRYGVHVWGSVAAVAVALVAEQWMLRRRARGVAAATQQELP